MCVIDCIPSQANRIEPAYGRLCDKDGKPIKLVPTIVVRAKVGDEKQEVNLLEAGHRSAADAIVQLLRPSGRTHKAFNGMSGRRLLSAGQDCADVAGLRHVGLCAERREDSTTDQLDHPRFDVTRHRRSSQFNAALDYESAGVCPAKATRSCREYWHGPGLATVPAWRDRSIAAEICRHTSASTSALLRHRLARTPKRPIALQRYLLGLSLVAMTYFDGKTFNLRQGCQLVAIPDKPMTRMLIRADGTETPSTLIVMVLSCMLQLQHRRSWSVMTTRTLRSI